MRVGAFEIIYTRESFTKQEASEVVAFISSEVLDWRHLGAIYYIFECRYDSIFGYISGDQKRRIVRDFPRELWLNELWDFSSYVVWELAKQPFRKHPSQASMMLPEGVATDNLRYLVRILAGWDEFIEVSEETEAALRRRTVFAADEVACAMTNLLRFWDTNLPVVSCCGHVLLHSLSDEELADWIERESDALTASSMRNFLRSLRRDET